MKKIHAILFIPFLLELSNEDFVFEIPIIPYSIGYISYIFCSFLYANKFKKDFLLSFYPIIIFWFGLFVGGFFSRDVNESLMISIASIPYYFSCVFFSYLFFDYNNHKLIVRSIYFIFIVNVLYVLSMTISDFEIISYSTVSEIRNHHNVGFLISCSAIFLSTYYLIKDRFIFSFLIFLFSSIALILTESRSNFIFTLLTYVLIVIVNYKFFRYSYIFLLLSVISLPLINYFSEIDFINNRFSLSNTDYHINSTDDRVQVIFNSKDYILENIFGKGNKDFRVKVGKNYIVAHNMYITVLLSGGIISFYAFILLIFKTIRSIKRLNSYSYLSVLDKSLASVFFTITFTFFTIEFFGFNLLLYMSICVYFIHKSNIIKINTSNV